MRDKSRIFAQMSNSSVKKKKNKNKNKKKLSAWGLMLQKSRVFALISKTSVKNPSAWVFMLQKYDNEKMQSVCSDVKDVCKKLSAWGLMRQKKNNLLWCQRRLLKK
jgi:hypothetical protein